MIDKELEAELFEKLEGLSKKVNMVFVQITNLRNAIKKKEQIEEETRKLERLFLEMDMQLGNQKDKLTDNFNKKVLELISAPQINKSRQISKGHFCFFESVYGNPNNYGEMESNLSKLRKKCEVAWYGILQSYGKIFITAI